MEVNGKSTSKQKKKESKASIRVNQISLVFVEPPIVLLTFAQRTKFNLQIPRSSKSKMTYYEIKSFILEHYFPNSTAEHQKNSLYVVGIVHVHAVVIVYSKELADKMNTDTIIFQQGNYASSRIHQFVFVLDAAT